MMLWLVLSDRDRSSQKSSWFSSSQSFFLILSVRPMHCIATGRNCAPYHFLHKKIWLNFICRPMGRERRMLTFLLLFLSNGVFRWLCWLVIKSDHLDWWGSRGKQVISGKIGKIKWIGWYRVEPGEIGQNYVKTGRIKLGENSEHSVKVWWSIMFKVRSAKGEPDDVKEVSHRLAQAAAPGNEVFTWCLASMLVMEKFRWGNHPKRTAACQKNNGKGGYLLTFSLLSKS